MFLFISVSNPKEFFKHFIIQSNFQQQSIILLLKPEDASMYNKINIKELLGRWRRQNERIDIEHLMELWYESIENYWIQHYEFMALAPIRSL